MRAAEIRHQTLILNQENNKEMQRAELAVVMVHVRIRKCSIHAPGAV